MIKKLLIALASLVLLLLLGLGGVLYLLDTDDPGPHVALYAEQCSTCHGVDMRGSTLGPPLLGIELQHGSSVEELHGSIAGGYPTRGMPAWSETLEQAEIRGLAIYIAERRAGRVFTDFRFEKPLAIPQDTLASELHAFRLEVVAEGIDPLPYSIAPLPDGSILVTEKTRGLRIVSPQGELSELISGTPRTYDDAISTYGVAFGLGWLLDVAPHPDYRENGWIYLHFTDRCSDCDGLLPVSMNAVVRGRIRDGAWVDQEDIWHADKTWYSPIPDVGAGGRLAFDDAGHLYFSIGIKGRSNYDGIQDLSQPSGKIHRVHSDGRIPADNPLLDTPGALPSVWTYGHRSPQGLEFNHQTRQLWGTEMGPRGGDELNLLLPGRNYGWPLYSLGLDYDGTPVEYGKDLGIEFKLEDIEQPVVDFTPSPAIASFIFYTGEQFPGWNNHAIIGSLKGTELYRVELRDGKLAHMETLLSDLARIRDVESGPDGFIYLLLEHGDGSKIVRLVPAD